MATTYAEVKAQRAHRKATGCCIDCNNSPAPGRSRCQKHLDQDNARSARKRKKYYSEGRCMNCGGPKDDNPMVRQKHKCTVCAMADERSRHLRC